MIPELEQIMTNPSSTEKQINVTRAALEGWTKVLNDYEAINARAVESNLENAGEHNIISRIIAPHPFCHLKLDLVTAGKWFTQQAEARPDCFSRKVYFMPKYKGRYYTTQYYCDPSTVSPDIKEVCTDLVNSKRRERCHVSDEDLERLIDEGRVAENYTNSTWEPLPSKDDYYKLWAFENPQIQQDSVSLVPKKLLDNAKDLESAQSIMKEVPANVRDAMKSTGS